MFKRALHIVLSMALSVLVLGETVGLYVTKDICAPCGSETIAIEMLSLETELDDTQCCSDNASSCENSTECCSHNDTKHEHHKEHYYLTQTPVFFDKIESQEFDTGIIELFLAISFNFSLQEKHHSTNYYNASPPLPSGSECYRSLLCTYLI